MKTIPAINFKTVFIKRAGLIALLLGAPLAATAQYAVFTDSYINGSTTNQISNPGGSPFASFTSYDIAATKAATNSCPIGNGSFKIALSGTTSSGLIEA